MTRRVAIAGVIAVCVTALIVGAIVYVRFARDVHGTEDSQLSNLASQPLALLSRRDTSQLAQVRGPGGAVRFQSSALQALGEIPPRSPGYSNANVSGRALRVYTRAVVGGAVLSVAVPTAADAKSLRQLRGGILTGMALGALLASVALVLVTRRALKPVRDTARVADDIARTNDLEARVPAAVGTDEVARLADSMNRMLDRVQASDAALRRLVADASHELRSPVTTLRGNLELLTDGTPLTDADRAAGLADARAETERLQELVEELLTLARADAAPTDEPVVVASLLEELPGVAISVSPAAAAATVHGDPATLRALIRNLVENAERYAGGCSVTLDAEAPWLTLRVIDHGPGIPVDERSLVFGRFARGSEGSRTSGSGLGLAIVEATARAHGGEVTIEDTPGGGATFVVHLPRL
jgi:two-component system sensor histidine kinase MprB